MNWDFDEYLHSTVELPYKAVKKGPPEKGRIGGLDFTRYHWTWDLPYGGEKHEERAVLYLAGDDNRLLVLQVRGTAAGSDAEFRLAESAILTLQKP